MAIPSYLEKCRGAMLATAIGDALGWPNEARAKNRSKEVKIVNNFVGWTRRQDGSRGYDEEILAGEYSDDTQLTLSVARSLIAGSWEKFFAEKELPFWLNYERGGGGALLRAAKAHKAGILPWQSANARTYFNAGGNGSVMRILPHIIVSARTGDRAGTVADAAKDTRITHGHPRAFLGAACYAYALDYLLGKDTTLEYGELVSAVLDGQGRWGAPLDPDGFGAWLNAAKKHADYDFSAEWENTRARMVEQLEFIRAALKKGLILDDAKILTDLGCFGKSGGAGDVAALSAVYLASRYANNPSLGIKAAAFALGADTDTIASITGGLLGMLNGTSWIPAEWNGVQDYECLIRTTDLLLGKDSDLREPEGPWVFTPIGKMKPGDRRNVPDGRGGLVTITKWGTLLGQTLYIRTRRPNETLPAAARENRREYLYRQASLYDMPAQGGLEVSVPVSRETAGPKRQADPGRRQTQQFVLPPAEISSLLEDTQFKTNITFGKVLKVVRSLMEGKKQARKLRSSFGWINQLLNGWGAVSRARNRVEPALAACGIKGGQMGRIILENFP